MLGPMSAQYPNVPDLPGVPPVVRPGALLQGILNGATNALAASEDAREAVNASDLAAAGVSLNSTVTNAQAALDVATGLFADGSDVVSSLSGTIGNAQGALSYLGSFDTTGALASIGQAIDDAGQAFLAISGLVNPIAQLALPGSGDEANADTARQWGLFTQDGDLAAPVDNVVAFENSLEARISDYPVAPNTGASPSETVGFGSYNKVIVPYEIRLIMTRGGSVEDRQEFLKAIQDAWQSTELFNVVTPECVYLDMNVVGVRRQAAADRGVGLMALEVTLRKVRQTATLTFSQTKEPSGATQVKDGSVQPVAAPAASKNLDVPADSWRLN